MAAHESLCAPIAPRRSRRCIFVLYTYILIYLLSGACVFREEVDERMKQRKVCVCVCVCVVPCCALCGVFEMKCSPVWHVLCGVVKGSVVIV